jgi:hypothetical protein
LQLKVRDEWWNVNEVEGSVAYDLIGDVHVTRLRVPGFRNFEHIGSLGRRQGDDGQITPWPHGGGGAGQPKTHSATGAPRAPHTAIRVSLAVPVVPHVRNGTAGTGGAA